MWAPPWGHMERQEMEVELETKMETEMENWNGNSCTVVSNHWTSVGLNALMHPIGYFWAWSGIFPQVSRGQRSHAYLISCNKIDWKSTYFEQKPNSQPLLKHTETELYNLWWPWSSFCYSLLNMHVTFDLWLDETSLRSKQYAEWACLASSLH